MSSHAFAAGLSILSASPSRQEERPAPSTPRGQRPSATDVELATPPPALHLSKSDPFSISPAGAQTPIEAYTQPQTPYELQDFLAQTPTNTTAPISTLVPSFSFPPKNRQRMLCVCVTQLGNGLNDAALGALLPYIEADYGIGYAIVSLIFVTNAAGFILAAFVTELTLARLGRARTLMLAEVILLTGLVMVALCPPAPFGLVVAGFFFMGLGEALNLALNNVFCANLASPTIMLGAAHGSYGIGGITAPIAATAMVSAGVPWSRFYLISIGIRVVVFFLAAWSNKGYESEPTSQFTASLEVVASRQRSADNRLTKWQLFKRALQNKTTLIGAMFIFAYQGAEVSISGWVISYLINVRGGDPAHVGYVTSGFWGGITLGRFVLSHFAGWCGERTFVFGLVVGSIAFQLLVWFIPNVVGDAVAVSIVGLLLGPVYPASQTVFSKLLPSKVQVVSISFIASAGSSGGAIAPLVTGLLAQAVGTFVLHPICIFLFCAMIACWAGLPKIHKRKE